MYCWQVFCVDPIQHQLPFRRRTVYVSAGLVLNLLLGVLLMTRSTPMAPLDSLSDTHLGGLLLLGVGEIVTVTEIAYVVRQWSAYNRRRLARQGASAGSRDTRTAARFRTEPASISPAEAVRADADRIGS